jgi:hypothetical protein
MNTKQRTPWTDDQKAALSVITTNCRKGDNKIDWKLAAEKYPAEWAKITTEAGRDIHNLYQYWNALNKRGKLKEKKAPKANHELVRLEVSPFEIPRGHRGELIRPLSVCPSCLANVALITAACGGRMPKACPGCGANLLAVKTALNMSL